jgi:hypothetical protein
MAKPVCMKNTRAAPNRSQNVLVFRVKKTRREGGGGAVSELSGASERDVRPVARHQCKDGVTGHSPTPESKREAKNHEQAEQRAAEMWNVRVRTREFPRLAPPSPDPAKPTSKVSRASAMHCNWSAASPPMHSAPSDMVTRVVFFHRPLKEVLCVWGGGIDMSDFRGEAPPLLLSSSPPLLLSSSGERRAS